MQTYSLLREFADSWFLIAMFAFFVGIWVFAFWPGLQRAREEAASIPLRDDEVATCNRNCANCRCGHDLLEGFSDD